MHDRANYKKMVRTILSIIILAFSGCTANMVIPAGYSSDSPYAPINEPMRPGIIKYLNQGNSSGIAARRNDAYKKMYNSCGGKYRILEEWPGAEGKEITKFGDSIQFRESHYIMSINCINQGALRFAARAGDAWRWVATRS